MDEILAATFRRTVYDRLDYLDKLATDGDLRSRAALATTEITRLTTAWRSLLSVHLPDERGCCRQCSGWLRRQAHPCTVWATAHQHLIAADGPSTAENVQAPVGALPDG